MTKLKIPLLSLDAHGTIGDAITIQRRARGRFVREKPIPKDVKSPAQLSWRHMYQKVVALWHALSAAEKQEWESLARRKHMTGYAWFLSQALRPNPGIYLPLQGGTMQGDIDMASNRLLTLIDPTLDQEPVTKKYFEDNLPEVIHAFMRFQKASTYHYASVNALSATQSLYGSGGGRLYAYPNYTPIARTITRVGVYVSVAKPINIRLGVYLDNGSVHPGALIIDCGLIDVTSTGWKTITGLNFILPADSLAWYVATADGQDPTLLAINKAAAFIVLGSPTQYTNTRTFYYKDYAFGALPDPFPATTDYGTDNPLAMGFYW